MTQPNSSDDALETRVEFPDNRLLIDLFGEFNRNLVQIEAALGVQILHQGNQAAIFGEPDARYHAAEILKALYRRVEAGRELTPGDIDAEIRMGGLAKDAGADRPGDQMELFQGGRIEIKTRKKLIEPRTEAQKAYVRALYSTEMAFAIGPAGTGKTYLAVAAGVNMFIGGHVDRIILSRPAVEAGERLGFLPGDMKDKVDPYMQPLYDALNDFLPGKQLAKLIEEKRIEIAPLAFMRGRTLSNAFVVLDEAQNATTMQMKMFLTRLGEGSQPDGGHRRPDPDRPAARRDFGAGRRRRPARRYRGHIFQLFHRQGRRAPRPGGQDYRGLRRGRSRKGVTCGRPNDL